MGIGDPMDQRQVLGIEHSEQRETERFPDRQWRAVGKQKHLRHRSLPRIPPLFRMVVAVEVAVGGVGTDLCRMRLLDERRWKDERMMDALALFFFSTSDEGGRRRRGCVAVAVQREEDHTQALCLTQN